MSEYFPHNIWLLVFLLEQVYMITNRKIYQDNRSAIKMEINGRNNCYGN